VILHQLLLHLRSVEDRLAGISRDADFRRNGPTVLTHREEGEEFGRICASLNLAKMAVG